MLELSPCMEAAHLCTMTGSMCLYSFNLLLLSQR